MADRGKSKDSAAGAAPFEPVRAALFAVRVRKTPFGLHLYTATLKGSGFYGWGDTPAAARAKLAEQLSRGVR